MKNFSLSEIKRISPYFFRKEEIERYGDISYEMYRGFLLVHCCCGWTVYVPDIGYDLANRGLNMLGSKKTRKAARQLCMDTLKTWSQNKCEE